MVVVGFNQRCENFAFRNLCNGPCPLLLLRQKCHRCWATQSDLKRVFICPFKLGKITYFIAVFTIAEERGNFLYFHLRLFLFWPIKRDSTLLGFGLRLDILIVFYERK